MSTRDLIDAIASGDSVAIEQSFQQEMSSRIADRLDTMRQEVARNMFKEACGRMHKEEDLDEEEVDEELKGDQHKIDANKNGKIDAHDFKVLRAKKEMNEEELNLEDYSIEELEDFMMSEEYEQLDELSKNTLGSYIKKASDDMMSKSGESGFKLASGEGDSGNSDYKKAYSRNKNIAKAVDKLTK